MHEDLAREARHLHRCFFRSDAPAEVVERYVAANLSLGVPGSEAMEKVVRLQLDAEAVELALRTGAGSVLQTKIRILFYLVEVRSAYYGWFIGDGESRWRAICGLLASLGQSAWKYGKGSYLVLRHGLV